jgi:trehalose synthase
MSLINEYANVAGEDVVHHLRQLAAWLKGIKVVHVNSTKTGGGVAEILHKLIPLKNELGLETSWEVVQGDPYFFQCTKAFHNSLQGQSVALSDDLLKHYEEVNRRNAEELGERLRVADMVFIHDPQPLALLRSFPERRGKWIWRCHIDVSKPWRPTWKYLKGLAREYDASIFSLADFVQPLPHPQYLIPPSIDPLGEKNGDLPDEEVLRVQQQFGIDPERPLLVQISRFDRFKDPLGVIEAYRQAKSFSPGLQLVLAGGGATDDPEGDEVLREVRSAGGEDPDLHILELPPDANKMVNALQRAADIVLQKSVKEGFGLTVTEAMWKGKAVIGGNAGGIRLQVINHHTGFLVSTPAGAALRIRYLLHNREHRLEMGRKAKEFVRENYLLTRHLREYLTLMVSALYGNRERIHLA